MSSSSRVAVAGEIGSHGEAEAEGDVGPNPADRVNIFPRDVPAGGDTVLVDGEEVYLQPGCCIGYSAWTMHRSAEIFGDDADTFRPERGSRMPKPAWHS